MTSKERMLRALNREKPDRLPATVHQWQDYHLARYMGGMEAGAAFAACGLDASIQYWEPGGQFWAPYRDGAVAHTPEWRETVVTVDANPEERRVRHRIETPGGTLTYETGSNPMTVWVTEPMIRRAEDIELLRRYQPVPRLDRARIRGAYDALGDAGILRGFVWGDQSGCWQHACCLAGTETMILKTADDPAWVHAFMRILLEKKLEFIDQSLRGTPFDLIETGGGAGSDTVISPRLHAEYCLPYDRELHRALHAVGLRTTYHTCGGMMHLLDHIVANETDASETLSPPGVGGNVVDPGRVRQALGGRVALIGGMDQFNVLTTGSPEAIRSEVHRLFRGFGPEGGYILSACDHFFDAPPDHLRVMAEAARECVY
ncbi:MAG TPA: uroporphyrinogen decarboxylase family protein [Verrucomicrobiota bacterium]|nr:uroporphyrinogen decarboxylase family protein [Verrucomicrobiota bacterium]HNU52336.1 uroporphyrinogen decarboxylase family protein [Verrucomicrobiota bacterium]